MGLHGNPYDGHTLGGSLEQASRLCGDRKIKRAFVDRGYKGHGYAGPVEIHICGPGLGRNLPRSLRRWRRRRSAIEQMIGHMKNDGRLGRNWLLGESGDRMNAVLCAAGHNLRLILARLARIFASFLSNLPVFMRFLVGFVGRLAIKNSHTASLVRLRPALAA